MDEGRAERRLAPILAADIAGWSRLIGEEETKARCATQVPDFARF
jgi:hypothetical protein